MRTKIRNSGGVVWPVLQQTFKPVIKKGISPSNDRPSIYKEFIIRRHNNPEYFKTLSGISFLFDSLWLNNYGILYDYIFNLSLLNRQELCRLDLLFILI